METINENELELFENATEPRPKHGSCGKHRIFMKTETIEFQDINGDNQYRLSYGGWDVMGRDVYCAACNFWSTIKGRGILHQFMTCKNCGVSFLDEKFM